jgi:hypothetical protein
MKREIQIIPKIEQVTRWTATEYVNSKVGLQATDESPQAALDQAGIGIDFPTDSLQELMDLGVPDPGIWLYSDGTIQILWRHPQNSSHGSSARGKTVKQALLNAAKEERRRQRRQDVWDAKGGIARARRALKGSDEFSDLNDQLAKLDEALQ